MSDVSENVSEHTFRVRTYVPLVGEFGSCPHKTSNYVDLFADAGLRMMRSVKLGPLLVLGSWIQDSSFLLGCWYRGQVVLRCPLVGTGDHSWYAFSTQKSDFINNDGLRRAFKCELLVMRERKTKYSPGCWYMVQPMYPCIVTIVYYMLLEVGIL